MSRLSKSIKLEKKENIIDWLHTMSTASAVDWQRANTNYELRKTIGEDCRSLVEDAYSNNNREALTAVHELLAFIYEQDFSSANLRRVNCETQPIFRDIAAILEAGALDFENKFIDKSEIAAYPTTGMRYVQWLKKLIAKHRSSRHPAYTRYIAEQANAQDLAFFMAQETNLDPRFDDILSMLQIGLHGVAKMEIANNYYDEMGNGNLESVHTVLFSKTLKALNVEANYVKANMLLDAQIAGNLSACLALSRRHYYKAIGYFGVTEYLAPRRFKHVVKAWTRNGLPREGIEYHDLHIRVDALHAHGWMHNAISPLIDSNPDIGFEVALGAMIRLNSSARYLDALLLHFEGKLKASNVLIAVPPMKVNGTNNSDDIRPGDPRIFLA